MKQPLRTARRSPGAGTDAARTSVLTQGIHVLTRIWRDAPRTLWRTFVEYWDAIVVINLCLFVPSLIANAPTLTQTLVYAALVGTTAFVLVRRLLPIVRDNLHFLRAQFGLRPARAADRYVRVLFDEYAESFEDHLMLDLRYAAPNLVFDIVSDRLGDKRLQIVDLGCGTGLCGPLFRPFTAEMVGVDLSPRMLQIADRKKCYDQLIESEIFEFLAAQDRVFDLCLAADVFVYFGDLDELFCAIANTLRSGGYLAFTVETTERAGWVLQRNGRYAHSDEHVENCARSTGLQAVKRKTAVLRMQADRPVDGTVWLLRKP